MALSQKTKTTISRSNILEKNDLYPDRSATPNSSGGFDIRDTNATVNRLPDTVPSTTRDMNALFKWQHGDEVYGTQAKAHPGMKAYIRDINKAYGKQDSVKDFYVDTLKPIGPQLAKK
jgi:hypothetical protein